MAGLPWLLALVLDWGVAVGGEVLLFWGTDGDEIRVTIEVNGNRKSIGLAITPAELEWQVERFRRMLAERSNQYRQPAMVLYKGLLGPVAEIIHGRKRLLVALNGLNDQDESGESGNLDGLLQGLPFEALIMPDGRHLLEKYEVVYCRLPGSAKVKARPRPPRSSRAGLVLAMSGSAASVGVIGTKAVIKAGVEADFDAEMRVYGEVFGNRRLRILKGIKASEEAFRKLAPRAGIIHVALPLVSRPINAGIRADNGAAEHLRQIWGAQEGPGDNRGTGGAGNAGNTGSTGNAENGEGPGEYLVMADTGKGVDRDGRLGWREIESLRLDAALVVLSGCGNVGRGMAGERDVVRMVAAFLSAGCRSVMIDRWSTDPLRRAELLIRFHLFHMGNGVIAPLSMPGALRRAALSVMGDPLTSHPHYWAGFLLASGEREPSR